MTWFRPTVGKCTCLVTLLVVGLYLRAGGGVYSPGPLHADNRLGRTLGGVRSHAELTANCAACHPSPWSGARIADRCMDCHTDVRQQVNSRQGLHGTLSPSIACSACHTEHRGPHAALTHLSDFDHEGTRFRLTGKHRAVACSSCHLQGRYTDTPRTCVGCHVAPPTPSVHRSSYGNDCVSCHTTETWKRATLHHPFPINHGNKKGNACSVCHPNPEAMSVYTCYGCHKHQQTKTEALHLRKGIVKFQNCVECHPTGREKEKRPRRERTVDISPDLAGLLEVGIFWPR